MCKVVLCYSQVAEVKFLDYRYKAEKSTKIGEMIPQDLLIDIREGTPLDFFNGIDAEFHGCSRVSDLPLMLLSAV